MTYFMPAILSAAISCIVLMIGFSFMIPIKENRKKFFTQSAVFTVITVLTLFILGHVVVSFTRFLAAPSAIASIIVTVFTYLGFVVSKYIDHERLKKFLKRIGIIAVTLFLIEGTVFNFRSFTNDTQEKNADLSAAYADDATKVIIDNNTVSYTGDGSLYIPIGTSGIEAVSLDVKSNDKFFKSTVFFKDENFSNQDMPVGSKFTSSEYEETMHFAINPYGEISDLCIRLSELEGNATITNITFANAMPYEFYNLRFIVLLFIAAAITAIISFELYKAVYDCNKKSHKITVIAAAILCASTMIFFNIPDELPVNYSAELDMYYRDPYLQSFDAILEGRVNIDITPDQSILALENPYDASARDNVIYPWDRALYDGKYYSYYGITPVLTFYFPYYWITGDAPTMNTTCQFFGALAIIFMFGAITAFVKRFIKKPNFLLMMVFMVSSCVLSGLFMAVHYSNQYNVPNVTSTCFLMLCLWCGVSATNRLTDKISTPLFIVSGLAFILCLAARPTKALSALILAPLFIAVLLKKDFKISRKLISVGSFIAPIAIGLIGIMWYNYVRFDSPFDFGQTYQLTVSDINANEINFSLFPASIIHYFLQPLHISGDFPYVTLSAAALTNNGQYTYEAYTCGVFVFPIILLGCILMPMLVWHNRRNKAIPYKYDDDRIRNYTYVLMFVLMVAIAFMDYCMAGVIVDYLNDILPVLMLMSFLVILEIQQKFEKSPALANKGILAFSTVSIVSVIIFLAIILTIRGYVLYAKFPSMLTEIEKFVCFWH